MESCNTKGFTLIEVMVVIVIIGIVVAIALPNYIKVKNSAKEAEVKGNLHAIQIAIVSMGKDNIEPYLIGGSCSTQFSASDPLLRFGYLKQYPKNPFIRNGNELLKAQNDENDPLRPSTSSGLEQGFRFGENGDLMGNIMGCSFEEKGTKYQCLKSGKIWLNAYNNFNYFPFQEKGSSDYIPGEFAYIGPLIGFGAPNRKRAKELISEYSTGFEDNDQTVIFLKEVQARYPNWSGAGVIIVLPIYQSRD